MSLQMLISYFLQQKHRNFIIQKLEIAFLTSSLMCLKFLVVSTDCQLPFRLKIDDVMVDYVTDSKVTEDCNKGFISYILYTYIYKICIHIYKYMYI